MASTEENENLAINPCVLSMVYTGPMMFSSDPYPHTNADE